MQLTLPEQLLLPWMSWIMFPYFGMEITLDGLGFCNPWISPKFKFNPNLIYTISNKVKNMFKNWNYQVVVNSVPKKKTN